MDLMHNPTWIAAACDRVLKRSRGKAAGVDGVRVSDFTRSLESQLERLRLELKRGTYRPLPLRRVEIPKANGKMRQLGIPCLRDKIVQEAIRMALEPIFEVEFHENSYGFRPNRSAHHAVSVELGMNDQGGTPTEKFVANMVTMLQRIRGVQARPVIFSASPINNGDTLAALGRNTQLHEYATALKPLAEKEGVPYADQFHALVDVWGKNKPKENLANALATLKTLSQDETLSGVEHLRAFLAAQEKSPATGVALQGDPVHPGAPGQLMMAAALLKALEADGFVSSASLDAAGKLNEAKGCTINQIKAEGGRLEFDRLDQRLPFPLPDDGVAALRLDPAILELSQYALKVAGLKDGASYALKLNGVPVLVAPAKAFEAGVNLTALGTSAGSKQVSPVVAQSRAILGAVAAKEALVSQWRSLSQKAHADGAPAELKEQLAVLGKKVAEADEKIREAARPQKLHCEISTVP
jgi:lysophospholipase L1-like esterase